MAHPDYPTSNDVSDTNRTFVRGTVALAALVAGGHAVGLDARFAAAAVATGVAFACAALLLLTQPSDQPANL